MVTDEHVTSPHFPMIRFAWEGLSAKIPMGYLHL